MYYEEYAKLTPVLTAVRMLPMTVAGALCNVFVVLVISRVDLVFLIGTILNQEQNHPLILGQFSALRLLAWGPCYSQLFGRLHRTGRTAFRRRLWQCLGETLYSQPVLCSWRR